MFCVGHLLLDMGHTLSMTNKTPSKPRLEKTIFAFASQCQFVRSESYIHWSFLALGSHLTSTLAGPLRVVLPVSVRSCMSVLLCLEDTVTSGSYSLSSSSTTWLPEPCEEGFDLIKTSHSGLTLLKHIVQL